MPVWGSKWPSQPRCIATGALPYDCQPTRWIPTSINRVSPGGNDSVGSAAGAEMAKLARHRATAKRREGMIAPGREEGGVGSSPSAVRRAETWAGWIQCTRRANRRESSSWRAAPALPLPRRGGDGLLDPFPQEERGEFSTLSRRERGTVARPFPGGRGDVLLAPSRKRGAFNVTPTAAGRCAWAPSRNSIGTARRAQSGSG